MNGVLPTKRVSGARITGQAGTKPARTLLRTMTDTKVSVTPVAKMEDAYETVTASSLG
jgi:hypothetical protein